MTCPPQAHVALVLITGGLAHALTVLPQVGTPEAKPSRREVLSCLAALWWQWCRVPAFFRTCCSLRPQRTQPLAVSVLSKAPLVSLGLVLTPEDAWSSVLGHGSQRAQQSSDGLRRKTQGARSLFFYPIAGRKQFARHEWAQKAAYLLGCSLEELSSAIFKHQLKGGTLQRSTSFRQGPEESGLGDGTGAPSPVAAGCDWEAPCRPHCCLLWRGETAGVNRCFHQRERPSPRAPC